MSIEIEDTMKEKLTISLINYLEQIYILQQISDDVRVTDVAKSMNLSKPSVNRAMNTLIERGYIIHEHYGSIKLTNKGVKIAESTQESNRIIKKFLVEFLGIEPKTASKESNQIAYIISKGTRKKLKKYMKKASKS